MTIFVCFSRELAVSLPGQKKAFFAFPAMECAQEKRTVEAKTYDVLQQQIWSLLPGFCNKTTDVDVAFPGIAKILGSAVVDRPDLRQQVMASLRKLVSQNLEDGKCSNPNLSVSAFPIETSDVLCPLRLIWKFCCFFLIVRQLSILF